LKTPEELTEEAKPSLKEKSGRKVFNFLKNRRLETKTLRIFKKGKTNLN